MPMPKTREQLTAGEWAVLALIREEPAHGFALARALEPDGEVGRVWALRRPLVYRALETLERMQLVEAVDTVPSRSGPRRTIFATTPSGKRMLAKWLREPVTHVRDARSLLMLKLLFLTRRDADPRRLLVAQRDQFSSLVASLSDAVRGADGFEYALLIWRLEATTAAVRFTEAMLARQPRA
jgi:DNA-binding PadR family transcriptional regulator